MEKKTKNTKVIIKNEEIRKYLGIKAPNFPKYTSQIINLANQNAQGTRPKVVGQMSELIKKSKKRKLTDWEKWYLKQQPGAINKATLKITKMITKMKKPMGKIDKTLIKRWVKDLLIAKTFLGFHLQRAILKKGAEIKGAHLHLAKKEDEAKGIDGYFGKLPVSVKPISYKGKKGLREEIKAEIIYYKKKKGGIEVDYGEIFD